MACLLSIFGPARNKVDHRPSNTLIKATYLIQVGQRVRQHARKRRENMGLSPHTATTLFKTPTQQGRYQRRKRTVSAKRPRNLRLPI